MIHAADRAVLVGEQDLTGPLRDLVTTILARGDPALAPQLGRSFATMRVLRPAASQAS